MPGLLGGLLGRQWDGRDTAGLGFFFRKWWPGADLNCRPSGYESDALTN